MLTSGVWALQLKMSGRNNDSSLSWEGENGTKKELRILGDVRRKKRKGKERKQNQRKQSRKRAKLLISGVQEAELDEFSGQIYKSTENDLKLQLANDGVVWDGRVKEGNVT